MFCLSVIVIVKMSVVLQNTVTYEVWQFCDYIVTKRILPCKLLLY